MDDRKIRLKQLKKDCKREKRKHTAALGFFAVLFFILAVIVTAAVLAVKLPEQPVVMRLWELVGENPIKPLLEANGQLLLIGAAALWAIHLLFGFLKSGGRKKWKKTEAYLDYRTLRNTLNQEKKMK